MCGIVGFTGALDPDALAEMNGRQRHRGPDDAGTYQSAAHGVSLAMRRLSVIDVGGGHQPMHSVSGDAVVVFNGEIFNAPALRASIAGRGHRFATDHSDTEVLLPLWAEHGPAMVKYLDGMFAFVIHDTRRNVLFGARDRLGIKPLHYVLRDGRFAFASELKSLLALPWVERTLDRQSIVDYLGLQAVAAPRTPYRYVAKLPPATSFLLDVESGSLSTTTYWQPFDRPVQAMDRAGAARLVRDELEGAIERWSLSDVPVACSLSGGVDSSIVTALHRRARPGAQLMTFTLGFEEARDLDERPLARLVAERYGTEHHEIVLGADAVVDALDAMVDALDEPYGGGLPSWFVFEAMAAHVKVALTGVGGDELFGSYGKWWSMDRHRWRTPRHALRPPAGAGAWPHGARYHPRVFGHPAKVALLQPDVLAECTPTEAQIESMWEASPRHDARDAVTWVDLHQQLPNEFLAMVDRFSMAHGLEARTPLLDHHFVEAVLSLPPARRSPRASLKGMLVEAAGELLPPALLSAPKRGFVLPAAQWLRGRLRGQVEELLSTGHLRRQGIFRDAAWTDVARPHLDGTADKTAQLWTLLLFQRWYEHNVGAGAGL